MEILPLSPADQRFAVLVTNAVLDRVSPSPRITDLEQALHETVIAVHTAQGLLQAQYNNLERVARLKAMGDWSHAPEAARDFRAEAERWKAETAGDYGIAISRLQDLKEFAMRSRGFSGASETIRGAITLWQPQDAAAGLLDAVRDVLAAEALADDLPEEITPLEPQTMMDLAAVTRALEQMSVETTPT